MGSLITAIFLSLPFCQYNYKFAKKDKDTVDFWNSFIQLAIYKLGICIGLPFLVAALVQNTTKPIEKNTRYFISIYSGLILLISVITVCNKFRLN